MTLALQILALLIQSEPLIAEMVRAWLDAGKGTPEQRATVESILPVRSESQAVAESFGG